VLVVVAREHKPPVEAVVARSPAALVWPEYLASGVMAGATDTVLAVVAAATTAVVVAAVTTTPIRLSRLAAAAAGVDLVQPE
jgi:hypothetical protein